MSPPTPNIFFIYFGDFNFLFLILISSLLRIAVSGVILEAILLVCSMTGYILEMRNNRKESA